MERIDDLKTKWRNTPATHQTYNTTAMNNLVKSRISKQTGKAMQFFWASFVLQILVYALLGHVIVRYYKDVFTVLPALAGILLYIPFTHMLMKKFKAMAFMPTVGKSSSIQGYISSQRGLLESFFTFKKRYELFLIPLSCAIGVLLTFKLYVPGGAYAYPQGAIITFAISLLSCYIAIKRENERNFIKPITDLGEILIEYNAGTEQK